MVMRYQSLSNSAYISDGLRASPSLQSSQVEVSKTLWLFVVRNWIASILAHMLEGNEHMSYGKADAVRVWSIFV